MFNLEDRIRNRIVRTFKNRGFDAVIGHVKWRGNRLTLDDLLLKKVGGSGQSVQIKWLKCKIHLWRSLIHFAPEFELKAEKVFIDLRAVSDSPLCFEILEMAFRFGRNHRIAQLDVDGISIFLQVDRNETHDDYYLQIPSTAWDVLIGIIRPYLLCPWIKEAHSADKLSLLAHFKRGYFPEVPNFFNATINAKDFLLTYTRQSVPVDSNYLVQTLTDKWGISYIPYEQIPQSLVDAFVCTEDPLFWKHTGISPHFIGYALTENLNHQKIVRGASTITMQVARNLFLNHNRTLLRKAEEGIIALLLENYFKIDKQMIFELYANLIEFAPGVHGVAAASRFYFDKDVCDLSLPQTLTLTYIIPRPQHFYEALLDKTEQLQRNLRSHIRAYASTMAHKGMINPCEEQGLDYCIHFSPPFGMLDLTKQV